MSGTASTAVINLQPKKRNGAYSEVVTITPAMAAELLATNKVNRPIRGAHVKRIGALIKGARWRVNGDSIKITDAGELIDGQHRLTAVVETKKPITTVIVYGLKDEAFATIDTMRAVRTGSDVIALLGTSRYRNVIASALSWYIRWQSGKIVEFRAPENRVENDDIEVAFNAHPDMVRAVERAHALRRLCNVSLMAFFYYVLSSRDQVLADRMMETLENPAKVPLSDPFFRLRNYFTADHHQKKDPITTIAVAIKAANAAHEDRKIATLKWIGHGKNAEPFPILEM